MVIYFLYHILSYLPQSQGIEITSWTINYVLRSYNNQVRNGETEKTRKTKYFLLLFPVMYEKFHTFWVNFLTKISTVHCEPTLRSTFWSIDVLLSITNKFLEVQVCCRLRLTVESISYKIWLLISGGWRHCVRELHMSIELWILPFDNCWCLSTACLTKLEPDTIDQI
jgi:hypothetical protein